MKYFHFFVLFVLSVCFLFTNNISAFELVSEKPPVVIVIFGSTGDLTARKLFPAVYNLYQDGELNEQFTLFGIGRREINNEEFQSLVKNSLDTFSRQKPNSEKWDEFKTHLLYHQTDFDSKEGYQRLFGRIAEINKERGVNHNILFYLATDSLYFPVIIQQLTENGLIADSEDNYASNVIIEKPFGRDLNSAVELQNQISIFLQNKQIYRMDHYLGKDGLTNLRKLRFESGILEKLFHRNYVENIQITLSETIGISTRANFYENTGHLRDVIQNHAMQVLAFATMEKPNKDGFEAVHEEKKKLFDSIRPFSVEGLEESVIRGQYIQGVIQEQGVKGYREENGVASESEIETFVQVKLWIENERWEGVPIYVVSGKRLPVQSTQVTLQLKENPYGFEAITFSIQPKAEVFVWVDGKPVKFDEGVPFSPSNREAYENLILAAIHNDQSEYIGIEELLSTWRLFTPVLEAWSIKPAESMFFYEAGQWGPESARSMLLRDQVIDWKMIH